MQFRGRDPKNVRDIFAKTKPLRYKKGEIILRPEEIPHGVYYIEKGFIKIYSLSEDGDENLHIIYKEDEIFPFIWLFKDETVDVYYEAMTDGILRRIPREEFMAAIPGHVEVMKDLVKRIIDLLQVHVGRVENLEYLQAYPRLLARIIFLAERFGKFKGDKVTIDAPITHKDIADSINMTRETASRELERLVEKGLISYRGHLIVISSLERLRVEISQNRERRRL